MADPNTTPTDYSKLTVPQLKAQCKELKLPGYSKLGKAALLRKLAQHGTAPTLRTSSLLANARAADLAAARSGTRVVHSLSTGLHPQSRCGSLNIALAQHTNTFTSSALNNETSSPLPNPASSTNLHVPTIAFSLGSTPDASQTESANEGETMAKRRPDELTRAVAPAPQKKRKLVGKIPASSPVQNTTLDTRPTKGPQKRPGIATLVSRPLIPSSNAADVSHVKGANHLSTAFTLESTHIRLPTEPSSKNVNTSTRFRPLVPRPNGGTSPTNRDLDSRDVVSIDRLSYLDFSSSFSSPPPSSLQSISIPPSLSQRKHINAWSVILSGISDSERRKCALVSRAIRYAVYLSAIPIITRLFGARKFTQLSRQYNMAMTNFWPYLEQLRLELASTREVYNASFLAKFFGDFVPISSDIWGCPDNDKQLTVALRFLMARVWFIVSINGRDMSRKSVLTDVREIIKNEIWSVTVARHPTAFAERIVETFYVLEPTCEVIGLPPVIRNPVPRSPAASGSPQDEKRSLRVDWSDYVENRMTNIEQPPLLNHLKWTNAEEYTKGISKLWLSRISKEGVVGEYKRKVAERYVLACVVGNSVSGQWMSSSHMAQVFAGTASEADPGPTLLLRKREVWKVNLFLPGHHLVESVHFTMSGSKPRDLHLALAIVQTPGREYFILRDNGMEVGCEEDGVWPVWMELLGCDVRGIACS